MRRRTAVAMLARRRYRERISYYGDLLVPLGEYHATKSNPVADG